MDILDKILQAKTACNQATELVAQMLNRYWEIEADIEEIVFKDIVPKYKGKTQDDIEVSESGESVTLYFPQPLTKFRDDMYILKVEFEITFGQLVIWITKENSWVCSNARYRKDSRKIDSYEYDERIVIFAEILEQLQSIARTDF